MVQRRDGPRWLREHDDDDDDIGLVAIAVHALLIDCQRFGVLLDDLKSPYTMRNVLERCCGVIFARRERTEKTGKPRNVRTILVRGSMPPCRLRRRKFTKFDYEMVHSGVYPNKYVVSIPPLSTPAFPDCSQNIT